MGQRSQIVIITPPYFWNEGNPNNRDAPSVYVAHNQWLYGHSFVRHAAKLCRALEHHARQDHGIHMLHRNIAEAIEYANILSDEPDDLTHSRLMHAENGDDGYYMDVLVNDMKNGTATGKTFLDHFDNNNGYLLIEVTPRGHVRYQILTGLEDDNHAPRSVTPQQYVAQFYTEEQQKEIDKGTAGGLSKAYETLARYTRVNLLNRLVSIGVEERERREKITEKEETTEKVNI